MWNRIMHVYIEARGYLSYSKRPCSLTPAFDKKKIFKKAEGKKKKEMGKALRIYGWENKIRFSSEPPLMGFFFLDSRTRHCSRLWTNIFSWCKYGVYSATDVIISFYGHTLIFFFEFKLMFHFRSTFHRLDVILFFLYKFLFLFFGASNLRRKCFLFSLTAPSHYKTFAMWFQLDGNVEHEFKKETRFLSMGNKWFL